LYLCSRKTNEKQTTITISFSSFLGQMAVRPNSGAASLGKKQDLTTCEGEKSVILRKKMHKKCNPA
jgi:hypothetical protein